MSESVFVIEQAGKNAIDTPLRLRAIFLFPYFLKDEIYYENLFDRSLTSDKLLIRICYRYSSRLPFLVSHSQ